MAELCNEWSILTCISMACILWCRPFIFFHITRTTYFRSVSDFIFNFQIKKAHIWAFEEIGLFGLTTFEYTAKMDITIDEIIADSEDQS